MALVPDARTLHVTDPWYYREMLMALMLQEDITVTEVGGRLGIPASTIYRYLRLDIPNKGPCARPMQYPQQFLVELMLSSDARCRIRKPTTVLKRS